MSLGSPRLKGVVADFPLIMEEGFSEGEVFLLTQRPNNAKIPSSLEGYPSGQRGQTVNLLALPS